MSLRPVTAIALNTLREILRDKVVYTFFVFALVISLFGLILGSLSVGQDVRMILDLGLFGINTIGGIIAVFAGANLVYKELEKKTCYLIFTKPVSAWQFIAGKYLGLSACLLILVAAMGIFLGLIVYFVDPSQAFFERAKWISVSVLMVYLELLVIIAAAEFFSTFASPIMSVIFTVSFWMIGHCSASLQEFSRLLTNPLLKQLSNLLYWLLPDLQSLTRARYLIMYGQLPGSEFCLYLSAYIIAYAIILLVLAALVNEKRAALVDLNFYQTIPSPYLEILAAVLGLAIGSYLNVLALRTLKEESIWRKRSYCPQCDHALGMLELIPLVSYFAQGGKCKHCHKAIHWQYPLTEAATAIIFAAIVHFLAPSFWNGANIDPLSICLTVLAMLYFAATLVAITITDFREKLIPHEITYPAILLGIIYSATIRHDLLGTLAGVGASYLIFDFIDHFGIKFYYFLHPEFRDRHKIEDESALDDQIDFDMEVGYLHEGEEDEPFMVMGGGDAVLSALIAAWLGWERLIPALVIGFLVGAVMGGIYLLVELKKEKMLSGALKSFSLWFGGFAGAMALGIYGLSFNFPQASLWNNPVTYLLIFALGFGGGTLGIMSAPGPRLVKHFPFGPALAVGALCSIFLIVGSGESFIKPY